MAIKSNKHRDATEFIPSVGRLGLLFGNKQKEKIRSNEKRRLEKDIYSNYNQLVDIRWSVGVVFYGDR